MRRITSTNSDSSSPTRSLYLHRDENGICRGQSQTLAEFRAAPPTVNAAVTELGVLATVLGGDLTASEHVPAQTFALSESNVRGNTSLVLPAESVAMSDDGFPCQVVARSAEVVIVRVLGQQVIVPTGATPRAIRFDGDGYVFHKGSGGPAKSGSIQRKRHRDATWFAYSRSHRGVRSSRAGCDIGIPRSRFERRRGIEKNDPP